MASELLIRTQQRLEAYYKAEMAVLAGQSYTIGTKSLTRANLSWIKSQINDLEKKVSELKSKESGKGRRKAYRITPRDL